MASVTSRSTCHRSLHLRFRSATGAATAGRVREPDFTEYVSAVDDPGEDVVGLREIAELQQRFADVDQVAERDGVVVGEERRGTTQEVRRRREIPSGESAPAGGGQVGGRRWPRTLTWSSIAASSVRIKNACSRW
jgi:hypothetical protein